MGDFSIYSNGILVGHSKLEGGDPPMGVAQGAFHPSPAYSNIELLCQTSFGNQSALGLTVQTSAGLEISCTAVCIQDLSAEAGEVFAEVSVLGIPYPLYEELFPGHVISYEQQSSKGKPTQGSARRGA